MKLREYHAEHALHRHGRGGHANVSVGTASGADAVAASGGRAGTGENDQTAEAPLVVGPGLASGSNPPAAAPPRIESTAAEREAGRLIVDEERNVGAVHGEIYRAYLKAMVPGILATVLFGLFALREVVSAGADGWLAHGSTHTPDSLLVFLGVFALLGLLSAGLTFARSVMTMYGGVRAAVSLHGRLLDGVLRAPMSFFESTPTGRILNRFGKDMEAIDQYIPNNFLDALACLFSVAATLTVVVLATPLALCVLVPIAIVYYRIQQSFRLSSREVKRLESISRSPVFAHFAESLAGAQVIRAFEAEDRFAHENILRFEGNQRAFFTMISLNRWLGTRLEFLGAIIVFAATAFAFVSHASGGPFSAGLAGVSITYALMVSGGLNWAVRMVSEVESNMNAVERVTHYAQVQAERWDGVIPPDDWPSQGAIQIDDLHFAYRPHLPPVLKGISCAIGAGEKVGVIGRTGAGKSSLMLALFRIVEPTSGRILIDGVDTTTLELASLRSRIAIIPQDPVLFSGTIRDNIDPFHQSSDAELEDALARAHLASFLATLPGGLQASVKEGGANFSVGQKQLLCLARALLKRANILIMDEATASVDFETDAAIQQTIRREFRHATVITIAHRLNTILDCDRVFVLEAGKIVQMDSPRRVLIDADHCLA